MFDEAAFTAAGYAPVVRSQFLQVQAQEATHVSFLTSAIVSLLYNPLMHSASSDPLFDNFRYSSSFTGSLSCI